MLLKIKVIPQSSRLEVAGMQGDVLRIKLTKGAHDGEANEQLVEFLSKTFHITKSDIQIVQGEHNRSKTVNCPSLQENQLKQLLASL